MLSTLIFVSLWDPVLYVTVLIVFTVWLCYLTVFFKAKRIAR